MERRQEIAPQERRIQNRKPLRTPVALSLPGGAGVIRGRSIDISTEGLGLVLETSLPPGTPCRVHLNLGFRDGGQAPVVSDASVAYCVLSKERDGFKTGVQFRDLPAAASAALQRYLGGP